MNESSGVYSQDQTINNIRGRLLGGANFTSAAEGRIDGAVRFPGSSGSKIDYAAPPILNLGTSDFTYSLWFKGAARNDWRWLINQNGWDYDTSKALMIGIESNQVRVLMGRTATYFWRNDVISGTTTLINDTDWYHLAVSRSGTTVTAYLNGAKEGNSGTSAVSIGISKQLFLGIGPTDNDYWNGSMDDAAIWNTALSQPKLRSLSQVLSVLPDYGAGKMDNLFRVFDGAMQTYQDANLTWGRVTGLSGHQAGDCWQSGGAYYVQFDASGAGVCAAVPLANQWKLLGGGNWTASSSWQTATPPNGIDAVASFLTIGGGSVTVNNNVQAGSVVFDNSSTPYAVVGPGTLTLCGSSGSATLHVLSGSHSIAVPLALAGSAEVIVDRAADALTLAGPIEGSGSLRKSGPGQLVLSGSNDYDGGTSVIGGTLVVASAGALPAGRSLTIGSSATLILGGGLDLAAATGPSATPVPEPGTSALLIALGVCCGLTAWLRRVSNRSR